MAWYLVNPRDNFILTYLYNNKYAHTHTQIFPLLFFSVVRVTGKGVSVA